MSRTGGGRIQRLQRCRTFPQSRICALWCIHFYNMGHIWGETAHVQSDAKHVPSTGTCPLRAERSVCLSAKTWNLAFASIVTLDDLRTAEQTQHILVAFLACHSPPHFLLEKRAWQIHSRAPSILRISKHAATTNKWSPLPNMKGFTTNQICT
jgi:hypothetical protein